MKKASEFVAEKNNCLESQLNTIEELLSNMLNTDEAQAEFNQYNCICVNKDSHDAIRTMFKMIPGSSAALLERLEKHEWKLEVPSDDDSFILRPLLETE